MNKKIGVFLPVTLGMLTAFGPFVTDFYLPSLPQMGDFFHTTPSMIQMSLTASMVGLAVGQILIGPLSDKYGRKSLLIFSMILFVVSSVFCIFSPNIIVFNVFRFIQGLGGAGGIVLSKSISTDMFTGKDLATFMAIIGAINGIAPVCAPVVGGVMMNFTSWQGIFTVLLAIGIVLLILSCLLKESLSKENRMTKSFVRSYFNLVRVFKNPMFVKCTLAQMFCFFMFFGYISSSPFVLQKIYGLSPLQFSLCFGLNALMIGVGSACSMKFHYQVTCLRRGSLYMFVASILVAVVLALHLNVFLLMCSYMFLMFCFGLLQPPTTAIALDCERDNAGSASAVLGASGFVAGGVASPLVCLGIMQYSTGIVLVAGALVCFVTTQLLVVTIKKDGHTES